MSKITKNELKRNELVEWLKLSAYYFKNNIKVVIITISSIVFIIAAGSTILFIKSRNNRLSAEILAKAINTYHFDDKNAKEENRIKIIDSISLFKSILGKYPYTQSAPIAYYYLGNLNYQLSDYEKSLSYYQDFVKKYPQHTLINSVKINIANIYELQNNFEEAVKIYEYLINNAGISLKQKDDIKLNLARIFELNNQLDKAINIYSQLPNNEEAQFRLSCLSDK